ncbi:MAG: dihydrofolate reductase [Halodesulfurarchaeum sp.]|nr:dihydrofolate reductase [Halodesulfurarchaeum sp.]
MKVAIVVAIAENGVIGDAGGMPWHYPADLARFKELTMGHPVILGRRTYESIVDRLGEPLPGRLNVVLSTGDLDLPEGAVQAESIDEALELAKETGSETAYVVGGAVVYEQFLPQADRLHVTEIPESPNGDTEFPDWDRSEWELEEQSERGELTFRTYERRGS